MLPALRGVSPTVDPFLPGEGLDTAVLAWATPREILHVSDGDTVALEARIVKRRIGGRVFVMYGFNGQYPGPLLRVAQHSRIVVRFTNAIGAPGREVPVHQVRRGPGLGVPLRRTEGGRRSQP